MAQSSERLLSDVTCADVFSQTRSKPVIIGADETVGQATKKLIEHGISSAPVYNKRDHAFIGFFDFHDVNEVLLTVFLSGGYTNTLSPEVELESILKHESLGDIPVRVVTDHAKKKPFTPVHLDDDAASVLAAFKAAHRLPVTDKAGKFLGIVSQSDVVKYVYENRDRVNDDTLKRSLVQFKLDRKQVITIDASRTVLDALSIMHDKKVTSLPLVDKLGCIVSVITLTDLRELFKSSDFYSLKKPCVDFVSMIRQQQSFDHHGDDVVPYFGVGPTTSLEHAMGKLVATRAHRVFVLERRKPIGVVSLSDVLAALATCL